MYQLMKNQAYQANCQTAENESGKSTNEIPWKKYKSNEFETKEVLRQDPLSTALFKLTH